MGRLKAQNPKLKVLFRQSETSGAPLAEGSDGVYLALDKPPNKESFPAELKVSDGEIPKNYFWSYTKKKNRGFLLFCSGGTHDQKYLRGFGIETVAHVCPRCVFFLCAWTENHKIPRHHLMVSLLPLDKPILHGNLYNSKSSQGNQVGISFWGNGPRMTTWYNIRINFTLHPATLGREIFRIDLRMNTKIILVFGVHKTRLSLAVDSSLRTFLCIERHSKKQLNHKFFTDDFLRKRIWIYWL